MPQIIVGGLKKLQFWNLPQIVAIATSSRNVDGDILQLERFQRHSIELKYRKQRVRPSVGRRRQQIHQNFGCAWQEFRLETRSRAWCLLEFVCEEVTYSNCSKLAELVKQSVFCSREAAFCRGKERFAVRINTQYYCWLFIVLHIIVLVLILIGGDSMMEYSEAI